ncbi:hypothetical protein OsI_21495 [Oryza sativa Indica Group]|uniref:Uncharacterized protein n=4 Tax=Oryza TaxID=4527 RepID=Q5VS97_ORYSJ|nr:hypothetical protein OsI_21495 [Oryza sativa Indica Group]EAZ35717.1 hypothetical protein OsJ_20007 [Oryza sativa Japonica Group]BAD67678.1 hypothetical protein [Oryza sativa Japonica Group]BAD67875.1 hypothetical protein [Oryza sativa Japonica Group]
MASCAGLPGVAYEIMRANGLTRAWQSAKKGWGFSTCNPTEWASDSMASKWQLPSAQAYVQAHETVQFAALSSDQLQPTVQMQRMGKQACLANKCKSRQHHQGIRLRLITKVIHGEDACNLALAKQEHDGKGKREPIAGLTFVRVTNMTKPTGNS